MECSDLMIDKRTSDFNVLRSYVNWNSTNERYIE